MAAVAALPVAEPPPNGKAGFAGKYQRMSVYGIPIAQLRQAAYEKTLQETGNRPHRRHYP